MFTNLGIADKALKALQKYGDFQPMLDAAVKLNQVFVIFFFFFYFFFSGMQLLKLISILVWEIL
jgi:hypothetical protein